MNRIKELRKQEGLTLDQLSNRVGINRATLNRYENEKSEPKLETWVKLAQYFRVRVSYIQGIDDDPHGFDRIINDFPEGEEIEDDFNVFLNGHPEITDLSNVLDAFFKERSLPYTINEDGTIRIDDADAATSAEEKIEFMDQVIERFTSDDPQYKKFKLFVEAAAVAYEMGSALDAQPNHPKMNYVDALSILVSSVTMVAVASYLQEPESTFNSAIEDFSGVVNLLKKQSLSDDAKNADTQTDADN